MKGVQGGQMEGLQTPGFALCLQDPLVSRAPTPRFSGSVATAVPLSLSAILSTSK